MAELKTMLREYVAGCFTGIWVQTQEPHEAFSDIQSLCSDESWQCAKWDIDRGLTLGGQAVEDGQDPLSAVKSAAAMGSETSIIILSLIHISEPTRPY